MEITVLSRFMALEGDIATYRFGTTARKVVRENLKLSLSGLSNYIGSLVEKKFLIKKEGSNDMFDIWPILFPEPGEQGYMIKLINIG